MTLETFVALVCFGFVAVDVAVCLYFRENVKLRYVARELPLELPKGKEGR